MNGDKRPAAAFVTEGKPTEADGRYLRRAIANAQQSRVAGRHPFSALVVLDGAIIAEAQSMKTADRDATNHSEMRVLRDASATRLPAVLARATLYASTNPARCVPAPPTRTLINCLDSSAEGVDPAGGFMLL